VILTKLLILNVTFTIQVTTATSPSTWSPIPSFGSSRSITTRVRWSRRVKPLSAAWRSGRTTPRAATWLWTLRISRPSPWATPACPTSPAPEERREASVEAAEGRPLPPAAPPFPRGLSPCPALLPQPPKVRRRLLPRPPPHRRPPPAPRGGLLEGRPPRWEDLETLCLRAAPRAWADCRSRGTGGRGRTPSRTRWCSRPPPRPVTVTLNGTPVEPTLAGSFFWKGGDEEHIHAQLICECLLRQGGRSGSLGTAGWRGQSWVSTAQGFAFLSACLLSIITASSFSIPNFSTPWKSQMIYLFTSCFQFSGKDTLLMHKMLSRLVFRIETVRGRARSTAFLKKNVAFMVSDGIIAHITQPLCICRMLFLRDAQTTRRGVTPSSRIHSGEAASRRTPQCQRIFLTRATAKTAKWC